MLVTLRLREGGLHFSFFSILKQQWYLGEYIWTSEVFTRTTEVYLLKYLAAVAVS